MSDESAIASRGATSDGSRGLQSTDQLLWRNSRRVAPLQSEKSFSQKRTKETKGVTSNRGDLKSTSFASFPYAETILSSRSIDFVRRYATSWISVLLDHELKPMATIVTPLRGAVLKCQTDDAGLGTAAPGRLFVVGILVPSICAVLCLAGCAVGPNYQRPVIDSPPTFRSDNQVTNVSTTELTWWEVYRDDTLQALIREALTNSYDLRIALARVEQARALAMQARSQFVPSVNYQGSVGRGRNYVFGTAFPNNGTTVNSSVATLNAFWEVDLWGRVRRLNESARAQFLASEEGKRGVQLTLLSDVATTYFQLLELDQELEIASRTTNSFGESLRIFSQRVAGGTASALQSARAEAALEDAAAAVPAIRERTSATENQLCVLLGRNPGPIQRPGSLLTQSLPEIPEGLPSTLLERRPDVRQAEQILRSGNAQVGESLAEFFPKIGLTALLGKVSPALSGFTLGTANAWGIAAEASGPLFEGGRLVGQYRQSKTTKSEFELQYRKTILNAFREVSDALVSRDQIAEIRRHQATEVTALETAVKLSTERYVAGKADYYEVLEAQQQLFPAQLNLARTERDQLLAVVSLYKTLGGGWQEEEAKANR
jgi:multidrug efflux system outer membrane protein